MLKEKRTVIFIPSLTNRQHGYPPMQSRKILNVTFVLFGFFTICSFLFASPDLSYSESNTPTISANKDNQLIGIDVSHYQGNVDWQQVKKDGVNFAYLKATDGITFQDPRYTHNKDTLIQLHLPHGSYHFFEANDDPILQAKNFLKTTGTKMILPPVLDIEISKGQTAELIKSRVKIWLDYVEKQTACRPMIYSYGDFWETYMKDEFSAYKFWLADYAPRPNLPSGQDTWEFWQKSQTSQLNGIKGNVDLDIFNGDSTKLQTLFCKQST